VPWRDDSERSETDTQRLPRRERRRVEFDLAKVERFTTATDWLDALETEWTDPHVRGASRPMSTKPAPCQDVGSRVRIPSSALEDLNVDCPASLTVWSTHGSREGRVTNALDRELQSGIEFVLALIF
jgi:hypothetical protein